MKVTGIHIYRVADGKLLEEWKTEICWDYCASLACFRSRERDRPKKRVNSPRVATYYCTSDENERLSSAARRSASRLRNRI